MFTSLGVGVVILRQHNQQLPGFQAVVPLGAMAEAVRLKGGESPQTHGSLIQLKRSVPLRWYCSHSNAKGRGNIMNSSSHTGPPCHFQLLWFSELATAQKSKLITNPKCTDHKV